MINSRKIIISEPGFSNFAKYFSNQCNEEVILHRNFDINTIIFRIFRIIGFINVLEYINTYTLIKKYKLHKCSKLIVFKGCTIDYEMLDKKEINYTIYLWDSIKNIYNGPRYSKMNSKVMTFDIQDSLDYNFFYLPLFHFRGDNILDDNFTSIKNQFRDKVSLYGSYSEDRVRLLNVISLNNQENIKLHYILTISPLIFMREIILRKQSITLLWKYTSFRKLTRKRINDLLRTSVYTIDLANPNQTGMTSRTFEALSFSTKIVTNNKTTIQFCESMNIPVLYADFNLGLDENSISLFKKESFSIPNDFIIEFSINSFLKKILKY